MSSVAGTTQAVWARGRGISGAGVDWIRHVLGTVRLAFGYARADAVSRGWSEETVLRGLATVGIGLAVCLLAGGFWLAGVPTSLEAQNYELETKISEINRMSRIDREARWETLRRLDAEGVKTGVVWDFLAHGTDREVAVVFVTAMVLTGALLAVGWHIARFFWTLMCGVTVLIVALPVVAKWSIAGIWTLARFVRLLPVARARGVIDVLARLTAPVRASQR